MPRTARKLSESGIYHIMVRGINKETIFKNSGDIIRYLNTIKELKEKYIYKLYAYCFMNNHVHLLLQEETEPLSQIMRRLGSSYVYWYNHKHERVGPLFQDRFKSEPVEDDTYFLTVLRYIHLNPLKAGLCNRVGEYKWSSYGDYIKSTGITDIEFALKIINTDIEKAKAQFIDYHNQENNDKCLDMETIIRFSDEKAIALIIEICKVEKPSDLKYFKKSIRDKHLKNLKTNYNLSVRQIERLTGINRNIIVRA